MSELSEAMKAAVESVDDRRARRAGATDQRDQGVVLRDSLSLPPILHRPMQAATVTELLRTEFDSGTTIARVYSVLREVMYLLLLFWVCAVLLGFTEDKGMVYLPGGMQVSVAMASLVAAIGLRITLLGGAALNGVLERMVDRHHAV